LVYKKAYKNRMLSLIRGNRYWPKARKLLKNLLFLSLRRDRLISFIGVKNNIIRSFYIVLFKKFARKSVKALIKHKFFKRLLLQTKTPVKSRG